jgi:hypothetical protein
MNFPAASRRVSKNLNSVIPHLIEPAPYLIRGNPESKAKRLSTFFYSLMPALWTPAFAGVTDWELLEVTICHTGKNLLIKKTAGKNLPAVMRRIEEEKS